MIWATNSRTRSVSSAIPQAPAIALVAGVCFSAVAVQSGWSGEVKFSQVEYNAGRYELDLSMYIDSDPAAVYDLVTDYARLDRISDTIVESELLKEADGLRRRLVTDTCIWFFCFTATMVEDVVEFESREILTTIVPALSDYRYGRSTWRVSPVDQGTLVQFRCTLEPDFWIPPLIGTWLIKEKMREEAERTVHKIEQLIRQSEAE